MKYYVISKFYDSGKVKAFILLESEMSDDYKTESKPNFDQYVDAFDSLKEAEKFKNDCYLA